MVQMQHEPQNLCGTGVIETVLQSDHGKVCWDGPARVPKRGTNYMDKLKAPPHTHAQQKTSKDWRKVAFNSPYASEGQEKCRNVR